MIRRRLTCRGVVQGVGFRPSVYRLAQHVGLAGLVRNDPGGATIEVEGARDAIVAFERALPAALPPLARLDAVEVTDLSPHADAGFVVDESVAGPRSRALTPPDVALCPACRAEMDDADDRRRAYAFTTCTDCGPRYSVVRALPYDRARTSMGCFALCPRCAAEYGDPRTRRFHAETTCCPRCGPRLWACRADGEPLGVAGEALQIARVALARGEIVAVKGIGGFQLACRADLQAAVDRLRARKRRTAKPFAVMVRDLATARRIVELRAEDEALLASPQGPIVLAPRRPDAPIADVVAPGLDDLGVMLPTTPLHVELLRPRQPAVIVATSGNLSDEPICVGNRDALARLRGVADLFLLHDRDIVRRIDDSVVRTMPIGHALVRRSRGFVPSGLPLPEPAPQAVLALGGHLQNTACLASADQAFLSQHVGDLDTEAARAFLLEVVQGLEGFLQVEGRVLVADLHPDYPSTWAAQELARQRGGRVVQVQHHLAHVAAVLAEHGAFPGGGERAIGIVLDGTGYGPDGTAWGCEWLMLDGNLGWQRLAHGDELPLVGGEKAVREPWRVAVAALTLAGLSPAAIARLPLARCVGPGRLARLTGVVHGPWPHACGAGRVFEAAGALLAVCAENGYEGEAAMRLEALAMRAVGVEPWSEVQLDGATLPNRELLAAAARRVLAGEARERVASGLHATFCRLAAALTAQTAPAGVTTVAIGGGCLANRLLVAGLAAEHARAGFDVLYARRAPPGDGGLAYGQAALAAAALARDATLSPEPGVCRCVWPSR